MPRTSRSTSPRRGFTFMEILFSVMILGIGFIMLAAMFPAALKQTQINVEEAQFNTISHIAANDMQNLGYGLDLKWPTEGGSKPATPGAVGPHLLDQITLLVKNDYTQPFEYDPGLPFQSQSLQVQGGTSRLIGRPRVFSFHDWRLTSQPGFGVKYDGSAADDTTSTSKVEYSQLDVVSEMWNLVRGNMILPDNKEYGWVPLWSRTKRVVNGQPTAGPSLQLFLFPVRSHNKPQYDGQTNIPNSSPAKPNPSCDLTYEPTNFDPVVADINYLNTVTTNTPLGILQIVDLKSPLGSFNSGVPFTTSPSQGSTAFAGFNPCADGCFVVLSSHPSMPWYNGTVFRLGAEVNKDGYGNGGTGEYWSITEVHNLPSQYPWNINSASDIKADMTVQFIEALVIGRAPNPADPSQHSDQIRKMLNPLLLPRSGVTQELGYFPCSIVVK